MNLKRVFILAGANIALFIGSGFATGQELLQYFTSYGMQFILVLLVWAVAFLYYNFNFAKVGATEQFEKGNDIYKYFCGKYVGTFFDYYSTAFCYMSFFVMVGGASSTLTQAFGIPEWIGAIFLCVIVVGIVCLGLQRLVDIIGVIGPVKIAFFLIVGLIALIMTAANVPAGLEAIQNHSFAGAQDGQGIVQAGDNWLISGLSYAGFVLLWYASFTTLLGANNPLRELRWGIVMATLVISVSVAVIVLAQIANINSSEGTTYLWNAPVPNLVLANMVWPPLSIVYAVIVFIGICATAVPLLYNPVARFSTEGTPKFRLLAVVLGIAGLIIGLFVPYATLVNVIYVINGYIGAVLILFMLWRNFKDIRARKRA